MANPDVLDTTSIAAWIRSLDIGADGALSFDRVGAGQSNLTFLVRDEADHAWILRRPPLGELLASAHDVAREHRILSSLWGTGVPVPKVHGLTTDPATTTVPLMLMDFVPGRVLDSIEAVEATTPEMRRATALSMVAALGEIHRVDLAATGLDTLASHSPYAERQLKRWHRQWEQSRTRDLPLVDDLARRLRARIPVQRELSLVHGDFHLMNVLTDVSDGRVLAVLDWELSTLGDPLADLGGLMAYWPQADDEVRTGFLGSTLPGFPTRDELVAEYHRLTGRGVDDIGFWYVLGIWKIAIIAEGVRRRSLDDPRNTAVTGAIPAELVDDLVTRADLEARAFGF